MMRLKTLEEDFCGPSLDKYIINPSEIYDCCSGKIDDKIYEEYISNISELYDCSSRSRKRDDEYNSDDGEDEDFYIAERTTVVFWDLVTYPMPDNNLQPYGRNIRSALKQMGTHGGAFIMAYGENLNHRKDDLNKAGIVYAPEGHREMVLDVIAFANCTHGDLMVIPKPDPNSEFHRVLKCLESRHHGLFLVKPPDDEDTAHGLCLDSVQSIVACTQGLDGRKPIIRAMRMDYTLDDDVMEDFSKRITFVQGAKAGVFWDLEDFPFPTGWSLNDIYKKIELAFRADGVKGKMSIWAYAGDRKGSWGGDFLRKKTWESSIYFLSGGYTKSATSDRMLHDINLWAMDSPVDPDPAYLILVSGKVKGDEAFTRSLKALDIRNYSVSLITPPEIAVPAISSSEWPKSHFGEEYVL